MIFDGDTIINFLSPIKPKLNYYKETKARIFLGDDHSNIDGTLDSNRYKPISLDSGEKYDYDSIEGYIPFPEMTYAGNEEKEKEIHLLNHENKHWNLVARTYEIFYENFIKIINENPNSKFFDLIIKRTPESRKRIDDIKNLNLVELKDWYFKYNVESVTTEVKNFKVILIRNFNEKDKILYHRVLDIGILDLVHINSKISIFDRNGKHRYDLTKMKWHKNDETGFYLEYWNSYRMSNDFIKISEEHLKNKYLGFTFSPCKIIVFDAILITDNDVKIKNKIKYENMVNWLDSLKESGELCLTGFEKRVYIYDTDDTARIRYKIDSIIIEEAEII